MYDNLQRNYRVIFEGQPYPIFYKYFYPTGNNHDALWDLFNFARGLKKDKPRDEEQYELFSSKPDVNDGSHTKNLYEYELRRFLNDAYADTGRTRNAGVVAIPSSRADRVNRVTELVRGILGRTPGVYKDLTRNIFRRTSKDAAHGGGSRSVRSNVITLEAREPNAIRSLDLVIVVDDIVTSGNSFRAMTEFLQELGFRGRIINFAFARHFPSEVAEAYLAHDHSIEYEDFPQTRLLRCTYEDLSEEATCRQRVSGIVYDLDQTLIDDSVRDIEFEEGLWKGASSLPYKFYDGVRELMNLPLPRAIVSNRPESQLSNLFCLRELQENLPFPECQGGGFVRPVFSFPEEHRGDHATRLYKPHPAGVRKALSYLRKDLGDNYQCRIVGVGNTKEDVIAYKSNGIEAALALWGVPEWLKATARNDWQADYVFERVADFRQWLEARMEWPDYCEMGVQAESEDKQRACDFYEKALSHGIDTCKAAFNYAYLISADDPGKAIELYRIAIEAGDEYASTNNLALLIEDECPGQAVSLYERAMASGNKDKAPRNLAMLIKEDDPEHAIKLLRQAAEAGNDKCLASDLEPFVCAGLESAIQLYKDVVVAKDGKKACDLGRLIYEKEPEAAKELFELAIESGDEYGATFSLAGIIADTDKERACELYERSIAAGDKKASPHNLAKLVEDQDPERAISLYRMAIDAGDDYFATRSMAALIAEEDPEYAVELLEKAAKAGNKDHLYDDLEPLMRDGCESAIDLCVRDVIPQNMMMANNLGVLIQSRFPDKAKDLYELGFAAGDVRYAGSNLASLIKNREPDRAESLFRQSIAAGDDRFSKIKLASLIKLTRPEEAKDLLRQAIQAHLSKDEMNEVGVEMAYLDLEEGKKILQQAMDAGDRRCAPCNLAHLLLANDACLAKRLYEEGLEFDEPEAWCGLSCILRDEEPDKSAEYLDMLHGVANVEAPIGFFLEFVALVDRAAAIDAAVYLAGNGFGFARRKALELSFGSRYDANTDLLEYGQALSGEGGLQWRVVRLMQDRVLLLSESSVKSMAYADGVSSADWDGSLVRRWLNSEFAKSAFGGIEDGASRILCASGDFVTCLTPEEAESFACDSGNANLDCLDSKARSKTAWWLKGTGNSTMSAPYVNEDGKVGWALSLVKHGVRPAIWLAIDVGASDASRF